MKLKKNKKFTIQIDGEWVQPYKRNYLLKCCDCGLTHRLNFRIRKQRIEFQAFRLNKKLKRVW